MARSITFEVDTDPLILRQAIYDALAVQFPGWVAAEGNLDTALSEAYADLVADLSDLASNVPDSIFREFGATLMGLDPIDAVSAITTTTWTARDNAGHTIAAGTQVGIVNSSGELVPFETVNEVTIPPGQTQTAAGAITIQAVIPGADTAGLGGASAPVQLIDPLDWVSAVTMVAATVGGLDAESDDAYLDRLRTELQLMTPRPILPIDFAILARNVAGVFRALAIDGFIPPNLNNQERAVAVAVIDAVGAAASAPVKAAVDSYLQGLREVNFIVNVIDPTFSQIDVTVTVKVGSGFAAADVQARVVAAIQTWLSPATWGMPLDGAEHDWEQTSVVRYMKLAQLIEDIDGVNYITTTGGNFDLQSAIHGNALGRVDIALPGTAPLTQPGTIAVNTA